MVWKLADAKNRLSELLTKVTTEGPQTIRTREEAVVVISEVDYRSLTGETLSFEQHLLNIPKGDALEEMPRGSKMRDPQL